MNTLSSLSHGQCEDFIMAALWNWAGHYIFALWFLSFFLLSLFPRLISAAADWLSTVLLHIRVALVRI